MPVLYANNATTTLAASITSTATSLSVASGKGALFPAIGGSNYFYATITNAAGTIEIIKVTARSVDTFTVVRGQDGTTGVAWAAGDKVDLRITKAMLDDFKTDSQTGITSSNVTTALGYTPYNSTNPSGYITGITSGMVTTALGYTPLSNATSYLPLSGGTLTGRTISNVTGRSFTAGGSPSGAPNATVATQTSYLEIAAGSGGNTNSAGLIFHNPNVSTSVLEYVNTSADNAYFNFRSDDTTWDARVNGNAILHAGNYNSYAPTLTGTGASGTWGISITGSAASITGTYGGTLTSTQVTNALGYTPYNSTNPSGYITASSSITGYSYGISVLDTDRTIANRLPTSTAQSVRFDFANASAVGTGGNYAGVMTFSPWTGTTASTGDASYQLVFGSTATNGNGNPRLRIRNGIDSTWNAWHDVYTSASYAAQNQWTPVATGGVTRLNSTVWAKSGGTNNVWDAQIYSAEALPSNVYAQAIISSTAGRVMFGLSTVVGTSADTSADYAVIHYAFYGNLGDLRIYESGSDIGSVGTYTTSSVLTVTYDGTNVRYYRDGTLLRTVARSVGNGLYFDSSFYNTSNSSQLSNIEFGRLSQHDIRKDNIGSFAPSLTGTGASGTWGISITGNAATATSATSAGSVTGLTLTSSANGINPNSVTQNQLGYCNNVSLFGQVDGGLYSSAYDSSWIHQIYGDFRTGQIAIRGKNSGTWQAWRTVLDSSNYNSYAPTLTGTGASGTWGISITGNAATATTATNQSGGTVNATTGAFSGVITSSVTNGTVLNMSGQSDSFGYNNTAGLGTYIKGTGSTWLYGGGKFYDGTTTQTLVHSGNISTYAPSAAATGVMILNAQAVTANYTLTGQNAVSAGPITINTGVTVTISTGANWVIV